MSDEAPFRVSGYVNKQICRYWSPVNQHYLQQCLLHIAKVTMCCEVYYHGIIGLCFFENAKECTVTATAERHKIMLETFQLSDFDLRQ
jgi:hypothetical protein